VTKSFPQIVCAGTLALDFQQWPNEPEVLSVNVFNDDSPRHARAETTLGDWHERGFSSAQLCVQPAAPAKPFRVDLSAFDQVLRKTQNVALGRYRCPADHPAFVHGGGPHTCAYVAFHRTSVRMRIGSHAPEVITPNHVSFYNVGESYTREATGKEGDECDWIALSPSFLRALAHGKLDHLPDEKLFAHSSSPISPETFLTEHQLFATVQNQIATLSSARIDEFVASLIAHVLADATRFHGRGHTARRKARPTCRKRRERIVEDAKAILARDCAAEVSVFDLAHQLHCSAAHLSRTFHAVTGSRLNAYRQDLRLRKGVVMLEDTDLEIGDIALQLGFSSHSHFTSAFHRRFGLNPSTFQSRQR
jgi:AraC family transcriptional regulator